MAAINNGAILTNGELPAVGSTLPDFELADRKRADLLLSSIGGWRVLNIFPSIDTGVCATSVRQFNQRAGSLPGVTVVNVSQDLPFALVRFCGAEGLDGVVTLSGFRSDFAERMGVKITNGPMRGVCARAVVVIDPDAVVRHVELVPMIGQEPDYDAALAAVG